jgi:hypothetical protein
VEGWFCGAVPEGADLVVVPLSFKGRRASVYAQPPQACAFLVHDWIWRVRGRSAIVSWLLLKRVNLVTHESDCPDSRAASGPSPGIGWS